MRRGLGRLGLRLLVLLGAVSPGAAQDVDWDEVWRRLERVEELPAASSDRARLVQELEELAGRTREAPASSVTFTRSVLLAVELEHMGAQPAGQAERLGRCSLAGLSGAELWRMAALLPEGPLRVRCVLGALDTTTPTREQQLLAFELSVDEANALRLAEGARPIQEKLHALYPAAWSTINLALTLSRVGDETALDALMRTAIPREREAGWPVADLWSSWGTHVVGFGDVERGRGYLGRAVAQGSSNAALVLSRMELSEGRREAARSGFRPSILSAEPHAWALRGWGSSLLPTHHEPPVAVTAPRQP